jgi:hypothetical protein
MTYLDDDSRGVQKADLAAFYAASQAAQARQASAERRRGMPR